jgi:hypothetical protein
MMSIASVPVAQAALAASQPGSYTVPSSVPKGCVADASPALQSWIATVPNNSVIWFPANACYGLNESIQVNGRSGLTFNGQGATIEAITTGGMDRRELWFANDSNIAINNLKIIGADSSNTYNGGLAFQGGIEFDGVQGATLKDVTIEHTYGDFITLDPWSMPGGPNIPCRNVIVENSTLNGAGRQGISFTDVDGVQILNNSISDVALDTFDLEADWASEQATNITIADNTATPGPGNHELFFSNVGNSTDTGYITVQGNVMTGFENGAVVLVQAPSGSTRGPFFFQNNTFWAGASAYVPAFDFIGCLNCSVTNNTVYFLGAGNPNSIHETVMKLDNSSNASLVGNTLSGPGTLVTAANSTYQASANTTLLG